MALNYQPLEVQIPQDDMQVLSHWPHISLGIALLSKRIPLTVKRIHYWGSWWHLVGPEMGKGQCKQSKTLFMGWQEEKIWSWATEMETEKNKDWNLVSLLMTGPLSCKFKELLAVIFLLSCDLSSRESRYVEKII